MKLLRLKIDEQFRSLQAGFEVNFLRDWNRDESVQSHENEFSPYILAGRNGSGKSNVLEVLAAIFYHLECQYLDYRPASFEYDEVNNQDGFREEISIPNAFELEYLIELDDAMELTISDTPAHIRIIKKENERANVYWLNKHDGSSDEPVPRTMIKLALPSYIIGYSSGENELLSLPFFKMRFIQLDEYLDFIKQELPYPGRPESRQIFLDNAHSQAILICNLLFQDDNTLAPFRHDVGIKDLEQFRIILKRRIEISAQEADEYPKDIVLKEETEFGDVKYYLPILSHFESPDDGDSEKIYKSTIGRLKQCATSYYHDQITDTLYLDYYVNKATKLAFENSFTSMLDLFATFQVLLTLNLYSVTEKLKEEIYTSKSHYVKETIPTLASDDRVMRFKFVQLSKEDVSGPVMLKDLSDGEHQFLHSLGLCLLYKDTNSLFLLDEPETHFNPEWRSKFISRLNDCFIGSSKNDHPYGMNREMLITTHTPFLISDSKQDNVLVFDKKDKVVSISRPSYNTLGASINKITLNTFNKRETIGGYAEQFMDVFRQRFNETKENSTIEQKQQLISEINEKLGDSVEKVLLIKTILDSMEPGEDPGRGSGPIINPSPDLSPILKRDSIFKITKDENESVEHFIGLSVIPENEDS